MEDFEQMEHAAPEVEQDSQSTESVESSPSIPKEPAEIVDLASLEKVKFEGKEWSTKELREHFMRDADYRQKTQALSEERKSLKFDSALSKDLEQVSKYPELAQKFKEIYPRQYHKYLDWVLKKQGANQPAPTQTSSANPQTPEEYQKLLERLDRMEEDRASEREEAIAQRAAAINAELDSKFKTLKEKYPFSDEEAVVSRAQYLHEQGQKLDDTVWDALFKQTHDRIKAISDGIQSNSVQKQKELNQKGKDTATGGGIPSQAPRRPKTLKEAETLALEAINGS